VPSNDKPVDTPQETAVVPDAASPSADDFHTKLHGLTAALYAKFPQAQARLEQLSSHFATVHMLIDHLHDEAVRHGSEGN
jgi:hypothetical protein